MNAMQEDRSAAANAVPDVLDWAQFNDAECAALLQRPAQGHVEQRTSVVTAMLEDVRVRGDVALRELTLRLDGCALESLLASESEFAEAEASLAPQLKQAIGEAKARIEAFHRAGMQAPVRVETAPGVVCERIPRPISNVGLYVPAGSAPLPSTALMLGVPANLAGCPQVVLCTPPRANGSVDAAVLYAAKLCGIMRVFKLGGAQAIAAMAMGTASVPACDKLFGPGNAWVTEAKVQVAATPGGPAIDMPAGPSEVLVIADRGANPRFAAADLLSQAEHGPDSQVILLSDDDELLQAVARELAVQLAELPRAGIARRAMAQSRLIRVRSLAEAATVSNRYAPEHLILAVREPRVLLESIDHAGSVFLGDWSCESVGDYSSGTNHVLPTYGHARAWSGLSVDSFRKQLTVQELTREGLAVIGPGTVTLARAEGLEAHARAVVVRQQALEGSP